MDVNHSCRSRAVRCWRHHVSRERHDAARDRAVNELGWHVLRLPDHDVFADLDAVVARIADTVRRLALATP